MIKILHVLGQRPVGGIGSLLYNLNCSIDTTKIKFDYIMGSSDNTGKFDENVKELGADVYILPELKYKNTIKYLKSIKDFLKNHNDYDYIHVHSANIGIFFFPLARKYGIKNLIIHSHGTMYGDKFTKVVRNYLLMLPVNKLANIYFACSYKAGEFLFGRNAMESGKVHILNNAIDTSKFKYDSDKRVEMRNKLNISSEFVVGHIGSFLPVKNHKFLLDIFKQIVENNSNSKLVLVGDGYLKDDIYSYVKYLDLEEYVLFLGIRDDIEDVLQVFDVLLLPSEREGLPVVSIEAQATGLKCFVSNTITDEIAITDLVSFLSLEDASIWAKHILRYGRDYKRFNKSGEIINQGFDIKKTAKWIQDFYINNSDK